MEAERLEATIAAVSARVPAIFPIFFLFTGGNFTETKDAPREVTTAIVGKFAT